MKRRLLSAFLAVMMVLTMAPVAFAADETNTTSVGSYEDLVKAVANASDGDTIKLANDITLANTLTIDKNITLDGQKNTISGTVSSGSFISVQIPNDGDFTMTNCVIVPSGKVTPNAAINLSVNGKVSVTNCTFGAKSDTAGYMYNGLEFSQTYAMGDTNITGNTFYGGAFRHNCISFYKMAENANINISNNDFVDLNWDTTNAIRVSNYSSANATITLNSNIYSTHGSDAGKDYAGLLVFQIPKNHTDNLTKLKVVVNNLDTKFDGQLYYTYDDTKGLISDNEAVFHGDDSIAKYFVAKIGDTYYKTLADAYEAATENSEITLLKSVTIARYMEIKKAITLNLGGNVLTSDGSGFDVYKNFVIKNGTLNTATWGVWVQNEGVNFTLEADATLNADCNTNLTNAAGVIVVQKASADLSGTVTAKHNFAVSGNGTDGWGGVTINVKPGANITTTNDAPALYFPNSTYLSITGGSITGGTGVYAKSGSVIISDGTIIGNGAKEDYAFNDNGANSTGDALVVETCKYPGGAPTVSITGGNFKSVNANAIGSYAGNGETNPLTGFITGGYFTTDPSAYVASGYVAGTSDVSGYSYKVVAKTNTGSVEVKPDVADPEVTVSGSISEEDKQKVENAAKTVSAPTLGAETGDIVKDINEDTAKTLIEKATTVQGNNKKLYVQSSLKVEPTAYDAANKTLALKITPQYRIVASTAATADDIELGVNGKNAEVVQDYQPMNITKATVVTMELPAGFAVADGTKLSIQHTKSNDKVEYYTGTVTKKDDKLYLTFTTNGFSPFVISVPAAAIESKVYPTLQAAVDSAKNGDIIDLYKDVAADTKVTVAKPINFKVATNSKKFDAAKNIVAGSNTTVKVTGESSPYTYEFTYTKPSSGGSSGGSSSGKTTYKVTTSAVNNGGVNASPSNAEKGATITITLSPDKGYKLDKLTVTDGSGKTVSTVKKSDTVYTFTMPASAVKVGVSYVKATETPSETKFNDVSANDWFASAVDYVTGKGMMNGTADNTFSPKANTTRGMVVTVLYRLENQPSTSAASFTDVASGAYYANAVAWANANGIVSGYGSGKFGPNDKVTREQLAAILYRYAQYKKYDVSVGEDTNILSYDDAQSISSYAIPAIQWACGAGVVTGKSGSKLDPKGNATRAEVAAMLMRFCENVK